MKKLGHDLRTRLRRKAKDTVAFLNREHVPVEELISAIEGIRKALTSQARREAETKDLFSLLGKRKRLKRLAQAVNGRGPKNNVLLADCGALRSIHQSSPEGCKENPGSA